MRQLPFSATGSQPYVRIHFSQAVASASAWAAASRTTSTLTVMVPRSSCSMRETRSNFPSRSTMGSGSSAADGRLAK